MPRVVKDSFVPRGQGSAVGVRGGGRVEGTYLKSCISRALVLISLMRMLLIPLPLEDFCQALCFSLKLILGLCP